MYEEAVALSRESSPSHTEHDRNSFARLLTNYSYSLSAAGRHDEADAAAMEAVTIRRRLGALDPKYYGADLAWSLRQLGVVLSCRDRLDEAVIIQGETVSLLRPLHYSHPDIHAFDLALNLSYYAGTLYKLGQFGAAHRAMDESIKLWRILCPTNPQYYGGILALTLERWRSLLDIISEERVEKAGNPMVESVELIGSLHKAHPEYFRKFPRQRVHDCDVLFR